MKKNKILFLRGLPASGKSTYARELIDKHPGKYKRVNKDEIRLLLDNGKRSKSNEKFVLKIRDEIIMKALWDRYDVIVDDTNFHKEHEENIRQIAKDFGAEFEVKFFNVSLEECIERDAKREKQVGRKVIEEMYNKYLKKERKEKPYREGLKECIIVDIDGTLAFKGDRNIYDDSKLHLDTVNDKIREILHLYKIPSATLKNNVDIIICSGRMDTCKEQTEKWLQDNRVPYDYIYMRKGGDVRRDSIIKEEIYREHIEPYYNVKFVFDDRPVVVGTRRDMGLYVFDCNQPGMDF